MITRLIARTSTMSSNNSFVPTRVSDAAFHQRSSRAALARVRRGLSK